MAKRDPKKILGVVTEQISQINREIEAERGSLEYVPLSLLRPRPNQPRRYFDPQKMAELEDSIRTKGIQTPLLLRDLGGAYEIVAGERRYQAALKVGLKTVPARIRVMSEAEAHEIALMDNLQREDLNPLEETDACLEALAARLNLGPDEVILTLFRMKNTLPAGKVEDPEEFRHNVMPKLEPHFQHILEFFQSVGRMTWYSFVQNRLPLLKLPTEITEALRSGALEYTKARAIAQVKDTKRRKALLEKTIQESLSLSQIKAEIARLEQRSASKVHPSFDRMLTLSRRLKFASLDQGREKRVQELLGELEQLLKA